MKTLFFLSALALSSVALGAHTNPNDIAPPSTPNTENPTGDSTTIFGYFWSN